MPQYKRNAEAVLAQVVTSQNGQVTCKVPCKIHVPVRFTEGAVGLGQVGIDTYTYGLFAIILESGEYAVCNIVALMNINPYKQTTVTIDEVDYHEFHFEKNQVMIKNSVLVKRDELIYNVLDEVVFKGKVPWYVDYIDLGKIFDTAQKFAGSNAGETPEVIEFIASMVGRSSSDRTKFIREVATDYKGYKGDNVSFVPLKSVFYAVNNTVNKLAGSYFSEGVVSALVVPSEQASRVETLLRA